MNYKTNFYGAIGLVSTIGKYGSCLGQAVSSKGQWVFQKTRENLIELKMDLAIVGEVKVVEKLENASKWSEEKCKGVSISCQEWETWAQEKYEKAKRQEELKKDWEWNVNPLHTYTQVQKSPYWKAHRQYFNLLGTVKKSIHLPSCLRFRSL